MARSAFATLFYRFPGIVAFAESANCVAAFHLEENYITDNSIVLFYIAVHKRNSELKNPLEVLDCVKMIIEQPASKSRQRTLSIKMAQRASEGELDLAECVIRHKGPASLEQSLEELAQACLEVLNDLRESEGKPRLAMRE